MSSWFWAISIVLACYWLGYFIFSGFREAWLFTDYRTKPIITFGIWLEIIIFGPGWHLKNYFEKPKVEKVKQTISQAVDLPTDPRRDWIV